MDIKVSILLEYANVFSERLEPSIPELLAGMDKDLLIRSAIFLTGPKSTPANPQGQIDFIKKFFSEKNRPVGEKVISFIVEQQRNGKETIIFNKVSSLKLLNHVLAIGENTVPSHEIDSAEFENRVFKAYLLINSQLAKGHDLSLQFIESQDPNKRLAAHVLSLTFYQFDKYVGSKAELFKKFYCEVYKTGRLLSYLEEDERFLYLRKFFYQHYDVLDREDYLNRILSLCRYALEATDTAMSIDVGHPDDKIFFDKFIISFISADQEVYDFINIRTSPLYKMKDGSYKIIYPLFLLEKYIQGCILK